MKLPWKRTRGHSFDEYGRAAKAECKRKLEDMCEARGFTQQTIPSLRLGPLVACLRSYVKNGEREHMHSLAKKRAGYSRQRQERERLAANPLYKPCWQRATEQHSLNAKVRREKREEDRKRRELCLPPKPRVAYLPDDDQQVNAFRPPLPRDAVPFNPPAVHTNVSRPSNPRSNFLDLGIAPWSEHEL